jgi:hypothetical protein
MADNLIIDLTPAPELPGEGLDVIRHIPRCLNVLFDLFNPAQGEFPVFVNRTEQALVPGAVARQSQQQAAGFIGRSDGALFKLVVNVVHGFPMNTSALKFGVN